jgi:hypothetical protein
MGPIESLDALLTRHVSAIHGAARSARAGGDAGWDDLLRHFGVTPFDEAERALIVKRMGLSRGATPAEVRVVLLEVQRWAGQELARLRSVEAQVGSAALGPLGDRVASLAERETLAYEQMLGLPPPPPPAPPPAAVAPSLASIFANAEQTSKEAQWGSAKYRQVSSLTCVHCGGPQEQPMDFMCRYCRRPIAGR